MTMFMSRETRESVDLFNRELANYFHVALSYMAKQRVGAIVIIDPETETYETLVFLAEKCVINIRIIHVDNEQAGRQLMEDMGTSNIKAVVISSNILDKHKNCSLAMWLNRYHLDIPVWIYNCTPKEVPLIRKASSRLGILMLSSSEALKSFSELVGVPLTCDETTPQSVVTFKA